MHLRLGENRRKILSQSPINGLSNVASRVAKSKVRGIDTQLVIAIMCHVVTAWVFPRCDKIGDSVCSETLSADLESSIFSRLISTPVPASFARLFDVTPESSLRFLCYVRDASCLHHVANLLSVLVGAGYAPCPRCSPSPRSEFRFPGHRLPSRRSLGDVETFPQRGRPVPPLPVRQESPLPSQRHQPS